MNAQTVGLSLLLSLGAVCCQADITVKGRTLDAASGAPLAGLTVQARAMHAEADAAAHHTLTGANGTFSLEVPPAERDYTILVLDRDGRFRDGITHIDENTALGDLKLSTAGSLDGTVRDAKAPLAGVVVVAEFRLRKTGCRHFHEVARATTDADGGFGFSDIPPGEYRCFVDSEDVAPDTQKVLVDDDLSYLEMVVKPGCRVSGRLSTSRGEPVPGQKVRVASREAISDAEGRYALGGLGEGRHTLHLVSTNYAMASSQQNRIEFTGENRVLSHDLEVVPSASVAVVFDLAPGAAMPGRADLQLSAQRSSRGRLRFEAGVTDGRAVFKGLPPGAYSARVSAAGVALSQKHDLALEAGETVEQSIRVRALLSYSGVVKSGLGTPLGGARLRLVKEIREASGRSSMTTRESAGQQLTDDLGRFAFEDLTPDTYRLSVIHTNSVNIEEDLKLVDTVSDAEWLLETGHRIEGKVVAEDGTPVGEADVSVQQSGDMFSFRSRQSEKTDAEGRFAIGELAAGEVTLKVEHDGYVPLERELTLVRGGEALVLTLKRGLAISGQVLEADGTGARGIKLQVQGPLQASRGPRLWKHVETDGDGSFSLGGLVEGNYQVTVREGRETVAELDRVSAGDDEVLVSLGMRCRVEVEVVDENGAPVAGAAMRGSGLQNRSGGAIDPFGDEDGLTSDAGGKASLTVRLGQPVSITATKHRYLPGTATLALDEAPTTPVQIVLKKGHVVKGVVVQADDGAPVRGMVVRASGSASSVMGLSFGGMASEDGEAVRTDAQGRFTLEGVAPGVVALVVVDTDDPEENVVARKKILVEQKVVDNLRIELASLGSVRVTVTDAEDAPLEGMQVVLQGIDGQSNYRHGETDAQGASAFKGLLAGRYRVQVMDMATMQEEGMPSVVVKTVDVEGDAEAVVLLTFGEAPGGRDVRGTVVVNGAPARGGSIHFRATPQGEQDPATMALAMMQSRKGDITTNGTFQVSGLRSGAYSFSIIEDGGVQGMPFGGMGGTTELKDDQTALAIVLKGAPVTGMVRDGDAGVEGATVYLVPEGDAGWKQYLGMRVATTGTNGRYVINCVAPGDYDVRVEQVGFAAPLQTVQVSDGALKHDVKLESGVALKGTLSTSSGSPLGMAAVLVLSSNAQTVLGFGMSAADGSYRLNSPLPRGNYLLAATGDGYSLETAMVEVQTDHTWDAVLAPAGQADVVVIDARGSPVPGQRVDVRNSEGQPVVRCTSGMLDMMPFGAALMLKASDEKGRTVVSGLAPGSYSARLSGSDHWVEFDIVPLETTQVELKR